MSQVKFIYNSQFNSVQCNSNETMKEICQKFVTKIGDNNINNFLFLYNGNKINFDLTFSQQLNSFQNEQTNMMIILVYNYNDPMINQIQGINAFQSNQNFKQEIINNNTNGIFLIFRTYDKEKNNNFALITIQCMLTDRVSEVIQKYRNKANDQEPLKKFMYNAKELDPNKSIVESGLTNNAQIYVVTTRDVNGGK